MAVLRCANKILSLVATALLAAINVSGGQSPQAQPVLFNLEGQQVMPLQSGDSKAIVFLFVRTDCPLSNRYAPEIRRINKKFARSGVKLWLVYSDPEESVEAIRHHLKEYEYDLDALRDARHELAKLAGARVTPEAVVYAPGQRMVYRGRIDDRNISFGKSRPKPRTRDLEQVLDDLIAGKAVAPKITPSIGCFISDLQ